MAAPYQLGSHSAATRLGQVKGQALGLGLGLVLAAGVVGEVATAHAARSPAKQQPPKPAHVGEHQAMMGTIIVVTHHCESDNECKAEEAWFEHILLLLLFVGLHLVLLCDCHESHCLAAAWVEWC